MYKIKNNIKLEELEKFGFKKEGNDYVKKVMTDNTSKCWTYFETLEINEKDRIIKTRLYQDTANQEWVGYIEKTTRWITDLYKAGLVEKVGE